MKVKVMVHIPKELYTEGFIAADAYDRHISHKWEE